MIAWRHPNLVAVWLRAKKEDCPKLMCRKVLLTVERVVDLRIPKYSLTTSNVSPNSPYDAVSIVVKLADRACWSVHHFQGVYYIDLDLQ